MKALRRLQRVGEVTRTCGLDEGEGSPGIGDGEGYGGWKDGEGMRGLLWAVMGDCAEFGAEVGPACDAVSTTPSRRRCCE